MKLKLLADDNVSEPLGVPVTSFNVTFTRPVVVNSPTDVAASVELPVTPSVPPSVVLPLTFAVRRYIHGIQIGIHGVNAFE